VVHTIKSWYYFIKRERSIVYFLLNNTTWTSLRYKDSKNTQWTRMSAREFSSAAQLLALECHIYFILDCNSLYSLRENRYNRLRALYCFWCLCSFKFINLIALYSNVKSVKGLMINYILSNFRLCKDLQSCRDSKISCAYHLQITTRKFQVKSDPATNNNKNFHFKANLIQNSKEAYFLTFSLNWTNVLKNG